MTVKAQKGFPPRWPGHNALPYQRRLPGSGNVDYDESDEENDGEDERISVISFFYSVHEVVGKQSAYERSQGGAGRHAQLGRLPDDGADGGGRRQTQSRRIAEDEAAGNGNVSGQNAI